ncbi:hypothetical protein D0860_06047 [Hortaea werneckii]|uniref:DUF7918 domain-containing protein n=1 Tax=Hortaea werneckii TaxID=91943 RepID=A0A3M7GW69_HORWE|nr:hypothetical protein D0860_06047 [Hortaea werneckii]
MAIHPDVPGLTVSIDVAGQDLPGYDGDDSQDASSNIVTKYIEAVSGAKFAVSFRCDDNTFAFVDQAMVVDVSCDGEGTSQMLLRPNTLVSGLRKFVGHHVQHRMDGDLVYRAMMFSDLTTSEAGVNKDLFSKLKSLGTIVVKWYIGKEVLPRRRIPRSPFVGTSLTDGKVPEENLKGQAITHQTAGPVVTALNPGDRSHPHLTLNALAHPLQPSNSGTARMRESTEVPIKREIKRERIEFENDDDDADDVEIVDQPEKKRRLAGNDAGTEVVDLCGDD